MDPSSVLAPYRHRRAKLAGVFVVIRQTGGAPPGAGFSRSPAGRRLGARRQAEGRRRRLLALGWLRALARGTRTAALHIPTRSARLAFDSHATSLETGKLVDQLTGQELRRRPHLEPDE